MIYDCRKDNRTPGAASFPCRVRIVDPSTGAVISRNVFYACTSPAEVAWFVCGPGGEPMVDAKTRRKVYEPDGKGGKTIRVVWDRLERWERRPWVAVSVDTGEIVAKSEGCP